MRGQLRAFHSLQPAWSPRLWKLPPPQGCFKCWFESKHSFTGTCLEMWLQRLAVWLPGARDGCQWWVRQGCDLPHKCPLGGIFIPELTGLCFILGTFLLFLRWYWRHKLIFQWHSLALGFHCSSFLIKNGKFLNFHPFAIWVLVSVGDNSLCVFHTLCEWSEHLRLFQTDL